MNPLYHDHFPNASGIYRITCIVTGRIYIGSAINLRWRRKGHLGNLQRNEHHNPKLQAAWNKYGEGAFTFEVLELVLPISLTAREQYWLDKLKPFDRKGFNIAPIAGSSLGQKRSPESREKMSTWQRGKVYPERQGKKQSPEQVEQHRQAILGKKASEETKHKMGDSHRGSKRNLQTREKMRLAALGHAPTNAKTALVISPDGIEYTVHNLAEFCREHDLRPAGLANVASGKRKQYKGWKARYI